MAHLVVPFPIFVAATVLASVLGPLVFLLQIWFLAELRRWDRPAWLAVASPRWLDAGGLAALRYIQSGRYRHLENGRVRRLGILLHVAQLLLLLLIVGFVSLLVSGAEIA